MGSILISLQPVILAFHFVLAVVLIVTILLQPGKGDIGAAFGAGGSQSVFGVRGAATLLSRITTIAALLFLITSISLATVARKEATGAGDDSSIEKALKAKKDDTKPSAQPDATQGSSESETPDSDAGTNK